MKLSVLSNLYGNRPLEDVLAQFKEMGVEAVEIGCGGYPGKAHCDPEVLLNDDAKLAEFKALFEKYGIEICALSCHGNAVIPTRKSPPLDVATRFFVERSPPSTFRTLPPTPPTTQTSRPRKKLPSQVAQ